MKRKATQQASKPSSVEHLLFLDRVKDELKDVPTNKEEKEDIRKVFKAVMQTHLVPRPSPVPLDRGGDLTWDWLSVRLTPNAYRKLAYLFRTLLNWPEQNDCDAIPHEDGTVTITIRKVCVFQIDFTVHLSETISDALHESKPLELLRSSEGSCFDFVLDHRRRASVLVGDKLGMRTPCRCFWLNGEDDVLNFVLEIGMAEKSDHLRRLAHSYIERGTLCVMTIDIRRGNDTDIFLAYSLYRRGEQDRVSAGVPHYEVVESVTDVVVSKKELEGSVTFTARDFFPAEVIEKHQNAADEVSITISHAKLEACLPATSEFCAAMGLLEEYLQDPVVRVNSGRPKRKRRY
ncbi:MAG: hypothetical protein LQ346_007410 [Caloplaca aetnensis]|nr:MAG: hypothetical protein LQ346_007410 [Caloplaca aetnensis]